jgi:hypothetical protein
MGRVALTILMVLSMSWATALAGGWYLMVPPTKADIDPFCLGDPSMSTRIEALLWKENPSTVQFNRCLPLEEVLADNTPISRWYQVDSFASLRDCLESRAFGHFADDRRGFAAGPFGSQHPREVEVLLDSINELLHAEAEKLGKDKRLEVETKLPRENLDLFIADRFALNDWPTQFRYHDTVSGPFAQFALKYRDEYPTFGLIAAWAELSRQREDGSLCLASDDPRLAK